jgi:hypothetical protein
VGAYVDVTGRFHLAQDAVTTADTIALDLSKPFGDVAESADSVALEVDFIRDFADTATLLDTTAFAVDRLFDDAQPVADSAYATFFKSLSDSVAITEQFSVAGAGIVDLSDSSSPIDQLVVSVTKPVSDSVSLTDFGTVLAQDYCDITYFAADYVGTAAYF